MKLKNAWLLVALVMLIGLTAWLPSSAQATDQAQGLPRITKVTLEKKQLLVEGENFADGAKLLVNGEKIKAAPDEMAPTTRLIVNKANKRLPVDEIIGLQVRTPDGQISANWMFFTGLTLTSQNAPADEGVTIPLGRKFLLYFNDPGISWNVYFPPRPPVVEFVQSTQNIIFNSDGVYLASQPGRTFFIMEGEVRGDPPFRYFVYLMVE